MSSPEEEGENTQEGRALAQSSSSSPGSEELLSLEDLGARFQFCIAAVEDLERERDELIRELALLREPSLEAVQQAHEEIIQAYGQRACAELERDSLREEIRVMRRRLFQVTKECVACKYQLENRRQELVQKTAEQEELGALANRLTEELTQLQTTFTLQREGEEQRLRAPQNRRFSRELKERRRLSSELQSQIDEQHRSLQDHYEPRLLQLLERSETGTKALQRAKEELLKLREEIRPLETESCHLQVQKCSLQEQIVVMKRERGKKVMLYRLQELEDRRREINISVQLQQQQNKEMEELRKSLAQELAIYKGCLELYGQLFKTVTKKE
ncbi:syncoilin isoform X2 [Pseudophryne corroboree]|uniref:syncoilin isoform X2 n=1 Tax=Pseudophryne corroboree TaxID=495146 RepID=UPI00308154B9